MEESMTLGINRFFDPILAGLFAGNQTFKGGFRA